MKLKVAIAAATATVLSAGLTFSAEIEADGSGL